MDARASTTDDGETMALLPPLASPVGRVLALAAATAAATGVTAIVGSLLLDIPLRDPDGFLGPSWVRMPLLLVVCMVVDVVPRIARRARSVQQVLPLARRVIIDRWSVDRLVPIVVAITSFYVTYVGYRNLKNFLPFVHPIDSSVDWPLWELDRILAFGYTPADVLHTLLGTGVSAYVLSGVYMGYLFFVPISVAVALIWSKELAHGLWYVAALCLNWALGALSYYLIPASGPFWERPWYFADIPAVGATELQDALVSNRLQVLLDPTTTGTVSGIAAFASLHVSVVFTAALVVHLTGVRRWLRRGLWGYFALTCVATIYFGWHYLVDDVAGVAIGGLAVWCGAWAIGHLRGATVLEVSPVRQPVGAGAD